MVHNFDADIAVKYGMLEAVLLYNIHYWIEKNKANGKNFYDGTYWTYNSTKAFSSLFPYASERQIKAALKHLRDENILMVGNYNESTYDRTLWYALTEKGLSIVQNRTMHSTESYNAEDKKEQSNEQECPLESTEEDNRKDENVRPIPNNKPNNKPDINNQSISQSDNDRQDGQKKIDAYKNIIKTNIVYDDLISLYPHDQRLVDEIIYIMLDTILTRGGYVQIRGEEKPRALVASVLLKLKYDNIEYVLEKYKQQVNRIKNKQSYLLTMLYNSASETEAHYVNEVKADFWEGK